MEFIEMIKSLRSMVAAFPNFIGFSRLDKEKSEEAYKRYRNTLWEFVNNYKISCSEDTGCFVVVITNPADCSRSVMYTSESGILNNRVFSEMARDIIVEGIGFGDDKLADNDYTNRRTVYLYCSYAGSKYDELERANALLNQVADIAEGTSAYND